MIQYAQIIGKALRCSLDREVVLGEALDAIAFVCVLFDDVFGDVGHYSSPMEPR
jgi:hypothetical protein